MAFDWNFRELMRPRLANAYANRTWETIHTQPTEPMPTQMDPNGQAWLASQQARNAQNMQGYIPNDAKQGYGYDYEDRSQSIAGEVGQDYYGTAGGDRGATAATIVPEKIKSLESQITALEQRIAANKQKLQNWGGIENQIAALEARKFNRQDPTSVWRWKQDRETQQKNRIEDQKRLEAQKALNEAKEKLINRYKLDATLKSAKADPYMTRDQKKAMLMTLNDAMRDAQIHNDIEYMDKVSAALQELNNALSYEDLANGLNEAYLTIKGMVGKQGGHTKEEAVKAIEELLNNPQYEPVFRNNPGLREQMLNWKISKIPNNPIVYQQF